MILRLITTTAMLLFCHASTQAQQQAEGRKWAVATGHPAATAVGMEVLRNGGNVMDAAVAASLALGVAEPYGSGLGGKLVMLYHDAESGEVSCVEALCASPLKTDPKRFGKLPREKRRHGYQSVCVPGLPAGLYAAHEKWGSKPWAELVQPAIKLAAEGVEVSAKMRSLFLPHEEQIEAVPEVAKFYSADGKTPAVGSKLRNADLAKTLRGLAEQGADGFYRGETAQKIVVAAQAAGSPLTLEDFSSYETRFSKPLAINYRGNRVYSSPAPLTGGATVLALLKAQEAAEWPDQQPRDAAYIDHIGRLLQCFYPKVTRVVGDTPSAAVKSREILSQETISEVLKAAAKLDPVNPYAVPVAKNATKQPIQQPSNLALASWANATWDNASLDGASLAGAPWDDATLDDADDASTTHLVVVDAKGNMVSLTQSLSLHFGACVIAPGTGVLLNDSMSNFATVSTNSVNYVAPGKRPRSTVSPTLVTRDGLPSLAIGIPGGQRIPTTTAQLLIDLLDSKVPLAEAFDRPRFHLRRATTKIHPPNEMDLEEGVEAGLAEELEVGGWTVSVKKRNGGYFGGGNAAMYMPGGRLIAVGDTRRTNFAAAE